MAKDVLNNYFWENIHFGSVMVWYGLNQMIIRFFKASILPSSLYLIHHFL